MHPAMFIAKQTSLCLTVSRSDDVEKVSGSPVNFKKKTEFPCLFTGLGKLKFEYHVTLRSDARPVCLYTPRMIPHPLLPKVKVELEAMQ